jgi:hypothetical protein
MHVTVLGITNWLWALATFGTGLLVVGVWIHRNCLWTQPNLSTCVTHTTGDRNSAEWRYTIVFHCKWNSYGDIDWPTIAVQFSGGPLGMLISFSFVGECLHRFATGATISNSSRRFNMVLYPFEALLILCLLIIAFIGLFVDVPGVVIVQWQACRR